VSALETLRKAVGTEEPISLALIAAVPGVLTSIAEIDPGATQRALLDATSSALDALTESRATEGAALEKELVRLLAEARAALGSIGERAQGAVERLRVKTRERVHRILETADSARVEQEIVHLADRADITEELARLDSHFAELARLTADPTEPNGRRIDFLLQEAAREANTLGSKGSDAQIAQRVVDLRTAIERMREQAQNVE
jgi:uncharacterized protein (TIGR00255 family)